uniref:Serine/threonine-protein phosphatase 4 regulatory subunit 3-like central domain-containing protein n=1 Tax=Globodera rostochiensis TaxID=31243 RepID=A0A914HJF2_GLORO
MEMASESTVTTTTSSTNLLLDQQLLQNSAKRESIANASADSITEDVDEHVGRADSTVPSNDEEEDEEMRGENVIPPEARPSTTLEKVDFERGSHNRVKLYVLCDQRSWDDRGTGHVACLQSLDNNNTWCIIVRLETNEKNVLESKIQVDTVYQKQQGTLIVWSESDTCDLALSFQEKAGCTELWEKICRIQGKDPETDAEEETEGEENEPSDSSISGVSNACSTSSVSIPPCTLQNLGDFEQALSNNMFANSQREKMATAIQQNGYITKLCDLFELCEDLENTKMLNQLASIAKNLFLLNSNSILNELIEEKHFKNIVGMLEFDAAFVEPKKHREFLWERSKFREVLPISSEELRTKIHQTFRLQYVQDVCLPAPSIFEENLLTVLNSHLFFIRAEIVNSLLNDKELLQQLFEELRNPLIEPERQRDLTNFLKEFCSFAHSLQPNGPQGKDQFFRTLIDNNVLGTIDPCISSSLPTTRTATVELLTIVVDFNPQLFRDFLMKQSRQEGRNDSLLINKLIKHMLSDRDAEFTAGGQMSQVLRVLLDPEGVLAKEKGEFLQMFYKRAIQTLCAPIIENAKDGRLINDNYYAANRTTQIIDVLCFFVEHHGYNMRTYTIQKNLIQSVLVNLQSKHHFLALCALRLIRRIIGLKDDTYIRHICEKGALDQVVQCFVENGQRYNLLNSSLIELFEFIKTERIYALIEYIIQKHWKDTFSMVDYVQTFAKMNDIWEAHLANKCEESDRAKENGQTTMLAMTPPNAQWRKEREHDDEELFFSKDDDDEMPTSQCRKSGVDPLFPSLLRKRKANEEDGIASVFGGNITPPAGGATTVTRISKIVIRMSNKEPLSSSSTTTNSSSTPLLNGDGGVSSAGHATEEQNPSSTSAESENAFGVADVPAVKRSLVDYDDSDDDEEEEEEEAMEEGKRKEGAEKAKRILLSPKDHHRRGGGQAAEAAEGVQQSNRTAAGK